MRHFLLLSFFFVFAEARIKFHEPPVCLCAFDASVCVSVSVTEVGIANAASGSAHQSKDDNRSTSRRYESEDEEESKERRPRRRTDDYIVYFTRLLLLPSHALAADKRKGRPDCKGKKERERDRETEKNKNKNKN